MAVSERGTEAFGLVFDNLLGFGVAETRRFTNLYGLLYDRLIVSDSWFLTNASLQAVLSERDGAELLRNRIIVPARRDTAASMSAFLEQAQAKKMHGLCATGQFAAFVDAAAPEPIVFSIKQVAAAYTEMSNQVLQPEVLVELGVSEAAAATVARILAKAKAAGTQTNTNTFVKDEICPALSGEDGEKVMEAARAPYALNLPANVLHSGIIGPENFRGDEILAILRGKRRKVGAVGISEQGAAREAAFRAKIGDELVNWLLSPDVLADLTAEELGAARGTENRTQYLRALTRFLATPGKKAWDKLVPALTRYLASAAAEVFRMRTRAGRPADPAGEVVAEGDVNLRVLSADKPVELRGLKQEGAAAEAATPLQVVGRTISVPSDGTRRTRAAD